MYTGFPVSVYIDPSISASIGYYSVASHNVSLYQNGNLYKLVNEDGSDIVVSNVSTELIPGTTYR